MYKTEFASRGMPVSTVDSSGVIFCQSSLLSSDVTEIHKFTTINCGISHLHFRMKNKYSNYFSVSNVLVDHPVYRNVPRPLPQVA
jgi:hypothetical protein